MKPDFDKYTQTKQKFISIKCNTNCLWMFLWNCHFKSMKPDFDKYTQQNKNLSQSNLSPTT